MRIQTDRYNLDVLVPLDQHYAAGLLFAACILFLLAIYHSGVHRTALSANPVRFFRAVVAAAAYRGEAVFWLVWGLAGLASVLAFTSLIIFIGLVAFD